VGWTGAEGGAAVEALEVSARDVVTSCPLRRWLEGALVSVRCSGGALVVGALGTSRARVSEVEVADVAIGESVTEAVVLVTVSTAAVVV
jgi:hypothetical protein